MEVDSHFASSEKLVSQQHAASEQAIAKSEAATSAQLQGLNTPLGDLRERVGKIEAMRLGATETKTDSRAVIGMYVAVAGLVLTIIAMVLLNTSKVSGH